MATKTTLKALHTLNKPLEDLISPFAPPPAAQEPPFPTPPAPNHHTRWRPRGAPAHPWAAARMRTGARRAGGGALRPVRMRSRRPAAPPQVHLATVRMRTSARQVPPPPVLYLSTPRIARIRGRRAPLGLPRILPPPPKEALVG